MEKTDFVVWLNAQPEETRQRNTAMIAMRAAARVFPESYGREFPTETFDSFIEPNSSSFLFFRAMMTAIVEVYSPHARVTSASAATLRQLPSALPEKYKQIVQAVRKYRLYGGFLHFLLSGAAMVPIDQIAYLKGFEAAPIFESELMVGPTTFPLLWYEVERDVHLIEIGSDLFLKPLWSTNVPYWFDGKDDAIRRILAQKSPEILDFWTRWWDGVVTGRPLDWAFQKKVALIPDDIWQQGAAAVARAIREIEEQDGYLVSDETRAKAEKLLRAAIGTFTFNQVRGLITLGPFAEDLAFIKQPEVINRFLVAAADVRERIDALQTSFEQERRGMQGAGALQVYLGKIDEEFSKARQTQVLRVGTLLNWVNILRTMAADDSIRREISPLHMPLDNLLSGLDDLIRTYFAQALVRVAPLKDIRSDENVSLADLLQDVRRGMDVIRASEGKELVPLAPEVIAIFDDTLADLDLLVRAELSEPQPVRRSALRREFDFQWAQIVVSWLLYREASIKNAGWAVDALSSWGAMAGDVLNLRELIKWVIGFFTAP